MLLATSLFWLQYIDLKDRLQPEPRHKLISAYLLGIGGCGVALLAFWLTDVFGFPEHDVGDTGWLATYCFLVIGPIEEGAKVFVFLAVVYRWTEFDEPVDGLVYPSAIAFGFATMENFIHLPGMPLGEQLGRSFALPFTHAMFAAIWGLGIAHARVHIETRWKRNWFQIASVIVAMALHGLYDWLIFAHQASLQIGLLIFAIWAGVTWRARRLVTH
jgi:RsiW-degrading membrane proteinase PrsW (M82 family)